MQNNWGNAKMDLKNSLLNRMLEIPINSIDVVNAYARIDTFSQGKLKEKPLNMSARNMGKNDLWIAATTHVTNATLLTTDKDFSHLQDTFININLIDLATLG